MAIATKVKKKAKSPLRHTGTAPGGIHFFTYQSRTEPDTKHELEIDTETFAVRCSCKGYTHRYAPLEPTLHTPDKVCFHVRECAAWLTKHGYVEVQAVTGKCCTHCHKGKAEHKICDENGNGIIAILCAKCFQFMRAYHGEPDYTPEPFPDYEPEHVEEPVWDEGDIANVDQAISFVALHSGVRRREVTRSRSVFQDAYRAAARKLHPDNGGNTVGFQQLQQAAEIIKKVYSLGK